MRTAFSDAIPAPQGFGPFVFRRVAKLRTRVESKPCAHANISGDYQVLDTGKNPKLWPNAVGLRLLWTLIGILLVWVVQPVEASLIRVPSASVDTAPSLSSQISINNCHSEVNELSAYKSCHIAVFLGSTRLGKPEKESEFLGRPSYLSNFSDR